MKRCAFTLIELLVVVAIIGVLAAIAMPVITGVQSRAKQAACASNLRQLGAAIATYAHENDGAFPESAHSDERRSWVYTLAPYLGNVDEIRICPADPQAERRRQARTTSYVFNEYLAVPKTGPFTKTVEVYRLRSLPLPSRTITVFIGSDRMDVGISNDHTHSRNWKGWEQVLDDIQPDRHRNGAPTADRTRGAANYLYADGHVEVIEAAHFKQFIDRGINLAKPPEDPRDHQLP